MKNSDQDFALPPFPAFPSASRYTELGPVADALGRISRSIAAREAISLVMGPPGTGKSLVCAVLAKQFASSHDVIQLGDTSITDESSLLKFVLHRLGVAFDASRHEELEFLVNERLAGSKANPNGAILIVDEAATLTESVLESIRRLTNLMVDGVPALSVVLAGGVKLDETLTAPALEGLVQRVAARCYLHPLNLDETRAYLRDSISQCDASPDETISESAISGIYHATSGVPRLINQMMTEAIDCAAELGETLIDEHTIDKAWASLQQLPSPMIEEPKLSHEPSDIEFGELTAPSQSSSQIASSNVVETIENEAPQEVAMDAEPASPVVTKADPISLFGDFEEEEPIEIGQRQMEPAAASASDEMESMLHSQIVGLSQFAAENTIARGDRDLDRVADRIEMQIESASINDPEDAPGVIWYDEPDEGDLTAHRDDSDLVWVTEDVDVESRAFQVASDSHVRIDGGISDNEAPKLSVDYREMLQKMRGIQ
ncbi:MAG: AAA family ATPase [Planctomycetota bacterium]